MARTAEDIVRVEVHYCVSALVSTLACSDYSGKAPDMTALCDQAFELCLPIDDYEEAARQEGWKTADMSPGMFVNDGMTDDETGACMAFQGTWQELCEVYDIEPYQREVFEHWIVSDWLADRLAEKGEKVDKDFAGLTVWARTTTGQGIASDWVIEQIVADLNRGA